jgi:hypothetical protein
MDDAWGTIDEIIEWLDGGSTLGPEKSRLGVASKVSPPPG